MTDAPGHRRVLTGTGRAVALVGPGLVALGVATGWTELLALGVACLLALVAALWWLLRRPELVASRTIAPARVNEGEPAAASLVLRNAGRRRSPPLLASEAVGRRRVGVRLPSLAPDASTSVSYALPTDRRGLYEVGPLTIARSDPLRLVLVARQHGSTSTLMVHPRVHDVAPVPAGRARDMDGPTSTAAPLGGIAFHSLREYVPGDDLRLVHWRSSARTGQLMVRHNVVPNEPRLQVVLDVSAAAYPDDSFEDAVRVAASWAVAACRANFPLRLVTTGGGVAAADRGDGGAAAILDLLAAVRPERANPGLAALVGLAADQEGVSLGVVTGQPDPRVLDAVSAVRGRYDMVSVVQVGEQYDRPPVPIPGAFVVNCRTSDDFAYTWNREVAPRG
ncbi:MAG TPA: DUF58 domain-containing protein [Acidimicrobiales bacterium]|nr:DUF58 domain-containing protein [Acidimicrobiales bacterium]